MSTAPRPRQPEPKGTARALPAGAWDCHFHVFDEGRFPYAAGRAYTPPDAPIQAFQAACAARGVARAVLVHPSVFGADHRSFEATLAAHGDWLRGVAVVFAETSVTSDADIERWHALGARGTRLNLLFPNGPLARDAPEIAARVRPLGWHLQLLVDVAATPEAVPRAAELGLPVVVDHLGHHPAAELLRSAGFGRLLSLLRESRAWVKLSGAYRLSTQGPAWADAQPVVDALLAANPAQLVWGSDWPHPTSPAHRFEVPAQDAVTDTIFNWLPTPALRQQVLVDNPARLYGDSAVQALHLDTLPTGDNR